MKGRKGGTDLEIHMWDYSLRSNKSLSRKLCTEVKNKSTEDQHCLNCWATLASDVTWARHRVFRWHLNLHKSYQELLPSVACLVPCQKYLPKGRGTNLTFRSMKGREECSTQFLQFVNLWQLQMWEAVGAFMLNSVSFHTETAPFLCGLSFIACPTFLDLCRKDFARLKSW